MRRSCVSLAAAAASFFVVSSAFAQITLAPKTSFGGGDGWLAPGEVITVGSDSFTTDWLTTDNSQRSLAFNPVTGNLLVANNLGIRIVNATTGVSPTFMDVSAVVTGGPGGGGALNTVGVTTDGVVYAANLTTNASDGTPYRVYRWAQEDNVNPAASVYVGNAGLPGARVGDNLAVFGADASGRIAAGFGSTPAVTGNNSFTILNTGATATATAQVFTGPPTPAGGDFRLGITFVDEDTVYGAQGAGVTGILRRATFSGGVATLDTSVNLVGNPSNERGLGFRVVNGIPLLATVSAGLATNTQNSLVRVYDMTNPATPVLAASQVIANVINANGNGTAAIAWGNQTGNTISLYALNTNNGIQAFDVTVAPVVTVVKGDFGGGDSPDGSLNTPDGDFNEFDVEGFLLALNDEAAYLVLNPTLGDSLVGRGDFGGGDSTDGSLNTPDGDFNEFDVEGFLLALNDPAGYAAIQPAPRIAAIPEPAALGLLAPMGLLLARRRR